jgi:hypothetical protein
MFRQSFHTEEKKKRNHGTYGKKNGTYGKRKEYMEVGGRKTAQPYRFRIFPSSFRIFRGSLLPAFVATGH